MLLTGVQAIARLLVEHRALDRRRGLKTASLRVGLPGQPARRSGQDARRHARRARRQRHPVRAGAQRGAWRRRRCGAARSTCRPPPRSTTA
ncbi:hypothetical protein [Nocardioides convexus]|uniref:hypothetical protein n=1 Tax=Nocardioides convexus TaxID=2712224 RepID=UPI002418A169|nr:hypothetical protein [Nocardioides convexus]